MRIREGCILTATNSSDERVKSLIGCKGALHVVNGEPLRFVVGTNENARSFTTATTKRLGVIGVNIFVSTVTGTEYTFEFGMTENNAKQIAEMYLSRYNPTYWDGSGKVPSEVIFEICRVAVDSMYNGCTLDIQLCKIDACPCYAASIHLFEGGFWTGHGIGCFDKTALCYDIGSVHSLASAIMRICATYENLTNFRKVFVERLVISKERMNEINQYTDGSKKQDEIEFESVTFADGMCMDVRCVPRKDGPSWCEAAIYYADEDVVTSEPYNSFYNHWVCQTANATYHLYMCVADTE